MNIDRRIAAARKRLHAAIDEKCAQAHAALLVEAIANKQWLHERANFYSRSAGQIRRYSRSKP